MIALYHGIETEIVNRLQQLNSVNFEVVQTPQVEAEFARPFAKSRVTVSYIKSEFEVPKSTNQISQKEVMSFQITVQARMLRDNIGVHAVTEIIRRKLVGFQPTECSKMYLIDNKFVERDETTAIWTYSMTFATTYIVVEDFEYDLEPLLQLITMEYNVLDSEGESHLIETINIPQ